VTTKKKFINVQKTQAFAIVTNDKLNFLWKGQPDRNVIAQVIEENLTIIYVHQSGIFQKSSGNLRQLVFIKALAVLDFVRNKFHRKQIS
jgi:hypothetical protein